MRSQVASLARRSAHSLTRRRLVQHVSCPMPGIAQSETPTDETGHMAFGQQSGPPATSRQVQDLLGLVREAGFSDFRDARHPLDLTQRQAGGHFTRDEAEALIARLRDAEPASLWAEVEKSPKATAAQQALRVLPAEQLAAELERRGWMVIPP
jgi:hypothetical protein